MYLFLIQAACVHFEILNIKMPDETTAVAKRSRKAPSAEKTEKSEKVEKIDNKKRPRKVKQAIFQYYCVLNTKL